VAPRAIVTGGAGFIGSHVVDALLADGFEVTVIDDLSAGDAGRVAASADLRELDIVNFAALAAIVEEVAPSTIYHLAAQASVVASLQDPGRDCEVNVKGTLNVVEAAGRCKAMVVFTSTGGALYGDSAPMPTGEEQIPAPLSPYGASKWAAEAYVRTWSLASGIPHAVCRLGNVYGPRQNPHGEAGVVAIFSHHLFSGRAPTLYGHGKPTRDYVYVADVVRALLAASGKSGTYNIATGVETDVMTVWRELQKAAQRSAAAGGAPVASIEPELADLRPGELEHSCLEVGLAARELGWHAEVPVAQGLELTYDALVEEFERGAQSPPA
jgi:UDP-glucose 4-epimerase